VSLKIIREFSELQNFHDQWNQLLSTRDSKLLPLTHEWIIAWWKNFGENHQLYIYCVYDGKRLVAVAPFMKGARSYRGIPITQLRLLANGHSPFCDIITDGSLGSEQISRIIGELINANTEDLMVFAKLPETSSIYLSLIAGSRMNGCLFGIKDSLVTPMLQINGPWDDYFRSRSRKFRKSINNKLNRYAKEADFSIEREIVSSREMPILDEIIQVSKRSWKARVKNDLGSNLAGRGFLLDLVDAFGATNAVHVWIMRKAGVPVAFEFHIIFEGVVYPLRADFDENYRKYSPGSVLEYTALKTLFEEQKVSHYYSCADDYWYLSNWTDHMRKHFDVEVFARGFKPFMLHVLEYRAIPLLRLIRDKIVRRS